MIHKIDSSLPDRKCECRRIRHEHGTIACANVATMHLDIERRCVEWCFPCFQSEFPSLATIVRKRLEVRR